MKKAAIIFLKVAVPAALFAYLLWRVDPQHYKVFWEQPKRWDLMVLAQLVAFMAILVSILRWRWLVLAFDIPFTVSEAIRLGFLGYLLNFISFGSVGGDVFKAILVARNKPQRRPEAVVSVLLDRAIGLLGLIILAAGSLLLVSSTSLPTVLILIRDWAIALTIGSIAALLIAIYSGNWFERLLDWLQHLPLAGRIVVRMARAVRLLRNSPATLCGLIAMSVIVHGLLSLTVYLVSCGAYPNAPSLLDHLIVVPPALAAGAIPLAPGGLGYQEAALANLFNLLPNLPTDFSGMLVATIFRLLLVAIAGIGLVIYWTMPSQEIKQVTAEAATT